MKLLGRFDLFNGNRIEIRQGAVDVLAYLVEKRGEKEIEKRIEREEIGDIHQYASKFQSFEGLSSEELIERTKERNGDYNVLNQKISITRADWILYFLKNGIVYSTPIIKSEKLINAKPVGGIEVKKKKIVSLSSGLCHTLALDDMGTVYSCGSNSLGELGLDRAKVIQSSQTLRRVDNLKEKIKQVLAYENTSLALSESGSLYVWGERYGQPAIWFANDREYDRNKPFLVPTGDKIKQISSCGSTIILFFDNGSVYSYGFKRNGTLKKPNLVYSELEECTSIKHIYDGGEFLLFLMKNDEIYISGKFHGTDYEFDKIPIDENIVQASLDGTKILLLTEDGKLLSEDDLKGNSQITTTKNKRMSLEDKTISEAYTSISGFSAALTNDEELFIWDDSPQSKLRKITILSTNK
jgi:alpha-tubulin suppressor-like RCC1 family protein